MRTAETYNILLNTIDHAGARLSLGRTRIYEEVKAGELELVKIGRASRITETSIQGFIARRIAASRDAHPAADKDTAKSPSGEATPRRDSPETSLIQAPER